MSPSLCRVCTFLKGVTLVRTSDESVVYADPRSFPLSEPAGPAPGSDRKLDVVDAAPVAPLPFAARVSEVLVLVSTPDRCALVRAQPGSYAAEPASPPSPAMAATHESIGRTPHAQFGAKPQPKNDSPLCARAELGEPSATTSTMLTASPAATRPPEPRPPCRTAARPSPCRCASARTTARPARDRCVYPAG